MVFLIVTESSYWDYSNVMITRTVLNIILSTINQRNQCFHKWLICPVTLPSAMFRSMSGTKHNGKWAGKDQLPNWMPTFPCWWNSSTACHGWIQGQVQWILFLLIVWLTFDWCLIELSCLCRFVTGKAKLILFLTKPCHILTFWSFF